MYSVNHLLIYYSIKRTQIRNYQPGNRIKNIKSNLKYLMKKVRSFIQFYMIKNHFNYAISKRRIYSIDA